MGSASTAVLDTRDDVYLVMCPAHQLRNQGTTGNDVFAQLLTLSLKD